MSELKDKIKDILEDIAVAKAHGNYADGLWHYLRAYPNGKEETGWEFIQGSEVSPRYLTSEYFNEPGHPYTYVIADRESDWEGPYYSHCAWEDSDNWNECKYAHPEDDYENYICTDLGYIDALDEAIQQKLIPKQKIPVDETECQNILIAIDFIPFKLGKLYDDTYSDWIIDITTKILQDIWRSISEQKEIDLFNILVQFNEGNIDKEELKIILNTYKPPENNWNILDEWGRNLLHFAIEDKDLWNLLMRKTVNPEHRALIDDQEKVTLAKIKGTLPKEYGKTPEELWNQILNP